MNFAASRKCYLHEVAVFFKAFQALISWRKFMHKRLVTRDNLGHFGLDGGEIVGCEGLLAIEVVEESGVGRGAVAELGFGIELEDRRGENVRCGVAQNFDCVGMPFLF